MIRTLSRAPLYAKGILCVLIPLRSSFLYENPSTILCDRKHPPPFSEQGTLIVRDNRKAKNLLQTRSIYMPKASSVLLIPL